MSDLAKLLNFKPQSINYLLYKLTDASKYSEFEISKRSGGKRKIAAPTEKLKKLQSNLATLLANCLVELDVSGERKTPFVHGFVKGKSIVSNARVHRNKGWVLNLDIEDFFGTVNFGRVRGLLIKDKAYLLHPDVATIIAQICCRNNSLPQGAPSSPIVANLVARPLDLKLIDLANRFGLRYTRYADDITFSTRKQDFPPEIATSSAGSHDWVLGAALGRAIDSSGFSANPKKTRLQYRDSRQIVTGLVVNQRVNVTSEYRKQIRAMVHRLTTTGSFSLDKAGEERVANKRSKSVDPLRQLQGMLGFIDWIDLRSKRAALGQNSGGGQNSHDLAYKKEALTSQEKQYRKFLFYREFFASALPVIVTEGKTDRVHLYAAIKKLAARFPLLADASTAPVSLRVRVFPGMIRRTNSLMGLTGGTGNLATFIATYEAETSIFSKPIARQPVIVLGDLDDGWKKISAILKQKGIPNPDGLADFYRIGSNLYVICIPPPNGATSGAIEDLYPPAVLAEKLSGKTFDKSNKTVDHGTHYGKSAFAEKVVGPNASKIDFNGFKPVLARISAAIAFHHNQFRSSTTTP